MVEDTRVGCTNIGLEALVKLSNLGPVLVERLNVLVRDTSTQTGLLKSTADGTHGGLRGETGEVIDGNVNDISTGSSASNHARGSDTSSVVRVDVDRKLGMSLSDSTDKQSSSLGFEETGHVLDTEDVDAFLDERVGEVEVVLKSVLSLLGVGNVTRVTDSTLNDTTGLLSGIDTDLQVLKIVERVENSENVETGLNSFPGEVVNGIVRVRSVTDSVGTSDQSLQRNVGDQLPQSPQPDPRVLVEEPHRDIKGGTTPTLERVGVLEGVRSLSGDVGHVNGSHTGSKERLVGVSPCSVHDKLYPNQDYALCDANVINLTHTTLVVPDSLGEGLGTLFDDNVPPTGQARLASVNRFTLSVHNRGDHSFSLKTGLAHLALDGRSVNGKVTEVGEKLLGSILRVNKLEEFGGVIDEGGPSLTRLEDFVSEKTDQEGNVGFDTSNTELDQRTEHLPPSNLISSTANGTLDKQRIVMRSDLRTSITRARVQSDTITTSRSVDFNLTSVRLEVGCGILSGDTTLDSKSSPVDVLLGQTKLLEGYTSSNLNLSSDDVNTGDLFGNGVLDLDTRVDLNEVVAVLLVDEEFGCTGVTVLDSFREFEGVRQDGLSDGFLQIGGRGDFDDLLVTSLDRTVSFKEVNAVTLTIGKKLDFNVPRSVKESLNEDSTVTESTFGLTDSSLKALLETLLVPNDSHTSSTTTHGSLDDNGESVLLNELGSFVVRFDRAWSTGNDRNTSLNGKSSSLGLVTKGIDGLRAGTNEGNTSILDLLGELGILREEAVTILDQLYVMKRQVRQKLTQGGSCQLHAQERS